MNVEKLLILHEGEKLFPYKCSAGKLTIGVGRNIEDNGITKEESRYLLKNDIARIEKELEKFSFAKNIDPVRKAVVIDMLFNLGLSRFRTFKKMIAALDRQRWDDAAAEMVSSAWFNQVGARAIRLVKMMRSGKWPDNIE